MDAGGGAIVVSTDDAIKRETVCGEKKSRTGPAKMSPGMLSSTLWFGPMPYMLPAGRRSATLIAPLRIWSNTGTEGDENMAPLITNFWSWRS